MFAKSIDYLKSELFNCVMFTIASHSPQLFSDKTPEVASGELVYASCLNSLEYRASRGKSRPMVILRRDGGQVRAVGLTTLSKFRDGTPRLPIPNPAAQGLRGPGYLWGERVTWIAVIDIENHLGWADLALVATIENYMRLTPSDRAALARYREKA